jgi:hypothetical protein
MLYIRLKQCLKEYVPDSELNYMSGITLDILYSVRYFSEVREPLLNSSTAPMMPISKAINPKQNIDTIIDIIEGKMVNKKSHAEKTTVADKAIGFDYQYYYFLYRVFKLGKNESVGLEVRDDVHTELANDYQILIQLKHTTQQNSNGAPINLTTFDSDLWKTLSNWSRVISDKNAGREIMKHQLEFIGKSEFMLVTNKSQTNGCEFFTILEDTGSARRKLESLKSRTTDSKIQGYIKDVLDLEDKVLKSFLDKVRLELEVDKIIELCKEALVEKQFPEKRVEQLFRDLDSHIRQDNFIKIRSGEKIVISFKDFNKKYRRYFDIARNPDLVISQYYKALPKNLEKQTFIKQLVDIGDIYSTNIEDMAQYTRFLLTVQSNIAHWQHEGELTIEEIDAFNREAKMRWQNKFRSTYRQKNKNFNELAFEVLDEMRRQRLEIGNQPVGTEFSNGEYYLLSNLPEIGWQHNWDIKYK